MTSQVAITLLKSLEQSLDSYCELSDEGKTAFNMAISALELFGNSEQLELIQDRKRGHWIHIDPEPEVMLGWMPWYCSECKCGVGKHQTAFCPNCGADMRPQFEEPEINPCRGCEDYDWKGGCKSKGGCAKSRGEVDE